jgi:hypothetical protein
MVFVPLNVPSPDTATCLSLPSENLLFRTSRRTVPRPQSGELDPFAWLDPT